MSNTDTDIDLMKLDIDPKYFDEPYALPRPRDKNGNLIPWGNDAFTRNLILTRAWNCQQEDRRNEAAKKAKVQQEQQQQQ